MSETSTTAVASQHDRGAPTTDDILSICAISIVAGILRNLLHEGVRHGLTALLTGAKSRGQCESDSSCCDGLPLGRFHCHVRRTAARAQANVSSNSGQVWRCSRCPLLSACGESSEGCLLLLLMGKKSSKCFNKNVSCQSHFLTSFDRPCPGLRKRRTSATTN